VIATLFDFNGVLIDDELVHFAAFRDVMRPLGIDLDRATYDERYLGFDDAGAFKAMLIDAGENPTPDVVERLIEAKKPVYMDRIATELKIFDGAKEIVVRRAEKGPVGIVSGALRHEIEHALGVMGVRDRVGFIVSAEDTRGISSASARSAGKGTSAASPSSRIRSPASQRRSTRSCAAWRSRTRIPQIGSSRPVPTRSRRPSPSSPTR
jgi:phosphoglycolate phosphatase-like HAD superfamily hydrolase